MQLCSNLNKFGPVISEKNISCPPKKKKEEDKTNNKYRALTVVHYWQDMISKNNLLRCYIPISCGILSSRGNPRDSTHMTRPHRDIP